MKTNATFLKTIALFLAVTIVSEVFFPSVAYALTDGPTAPEFSDFEPVASTDMVNTFTGDFSYNLPVVQIPGPDGSGYAMSLSYHSGTSSEEEASWVGHGWTLNPGAINRNVKGVPDDYNGDAITQYNKTRVNWTATSEVRANLEITSKDETKSLGMAANFGKTYNNYSGLSKLWGLNVKGGQGDMAGSIGVQFTGRDPIFSLNVQPAEKLTEKMGKGLDKLGSEVKSALNKTKIVKKINALTGKILNGKLDVKYKKPTGQDLSDGLTGYSLTSAYGLFTGSQANNTLVVGENHGFQFNLVNTAKLIYFTAVGFEAGLGGSVSANANVPEVNLSAYGYYHNQDPSGKFMSDYYTEKGDFYNPKLKYLGIPFSSPDNFIASGEGVSGGFRLYENKIGHYFPNETESKTKIFNGGATAGVGFTPTGTKVSVGTELLGGSRKLFSRKNWHGSSDIYGGYIFDGVNENDYFFRFQNDMGGTVEYTDQAGVINAKMDPDDADLALNTRKLFVDYASMGLYTNGVNNGNKVGRSSFIKPYKTGSKLSGFSIVNEEGMSYTYGEPLYVKNEASLQIKPDNSGDGYITYKQLVTDLASGNKPSVSNNDYVVGQFKSSPYASTYLVTSITTPDYIDNAPLGSFGDEDLGGWTAFKYKKKYGDANGWYRWRAPYQGLFYQQNSISDLKDDMAGVNYGEKEVSYLSSVETKTHIAFFITNKRVPADYPAPYNMLAQYLTGTGTARLDGLGAALDEENASKPSPLKGTQELETLEKIVLFSKTDLSKPIQTTYFKYNYSICRKLTNSNAATGNAGYNESGKLTLERVWTETEDVVNTRISPYIFKYEYKTQYAVEVEAKYPSIVSYVIPFAGAARENPDYAPQRLDRWGNNQYDGEKRFQDGKEWLYQGDYDPALLHDPAAWQLKQIILPSGGEIHIQYEEKDYQYVQDKRAMAMVSLDPVGTLDKYQPSDNKFYLNLEDIGIASTDVAELDAQELQLEALEGQYVFFKFLYALKGNNPALDNCKSEYIDGYVRVNEVGREGNRFFLQLGEEQSVMAYNEEERAVPKQVCFAFVNSQRGGMLDNNDCEAPIDELKEFDGTMQDWYNQKITNVDGDFPDYASRLGGNRSEMHDVVRALKRFKYNSPLFKDVKNDQGQYCMSLNPTLSYIRIPMAKAKRGGGVRVKRLMLYDKGMEAGDAMLYGSEYFYENEDGTSSGVATNEPATGREENALVNLLERYKQTLISRIFSGRNKLEFQGPLGESLLPAASIGHSRVVVRSIHTGQTGGGFIAYNYHTVKEYPISPDYTFNTQNGELKNMRAVDKSYLKDNKKKDYLPLPLGLINLTVNREWATQGYNFILYNIHGQPESITTYGGGVYEPGVPFESSKYPMISQMKYEFYEPGEKVKMMRPDGNYYMDLPGKEMDVTMEMRSIREKYYNPALDFDVEFALPPSILVTYALSFSYADALMNTHVTSKVTTYPVIQKRVISMQDGVSTVTENVAFSPETGKPLLTKVSDSYDQVLLAQSNGGVTPHRGEYYTMKVPASWIYNSFGPIATYGSATPVGGTNQLNLVAASITTYGTDASQLLGTLQNTKSDPGYPIAHQYSNKQFQNVVDVSVQTYSNNWFTTPDAIMEGEYNYSTYTQTAKDLLNQRFRPKSTYVYKTELTRSDNIGTAGTKRTYNSGYYTDMTLPDFSSFCDNNTDPVNCKWLKLSEITRYTPHGNVQEEKDIMNIYSSVRSGYKNTMPVMTAKNASYETIAFRSFEDEPTNASTGVNGNHGHSGKKSLRVEGNTTILGTGTPALVRRSGAAFSGVLKFWAKESTASVTYPVTINGTAAGNMVFVAQTGDWKLYEMTIASALIPATGFDIKVNPSAIVYLDDIRFEPYESMTNCFVYDNMLRVITSFDDQHFGVYYQYDQEGKLVRKQIETEKGIMTVQESQRNLPTIIK